MKKENIFLARKGISLSKTTVHRYMNKELDLHAVTMGKKRACPCGEKNKRWCTDFPYIRLSNENMHYPCTVMVLYGRSVVASLNSNHRNTELAMDTLKRAVENEKLGSGRFLHSDQGAPFTS